MQWRKYLLRAMRASEDGTAIDHGLVNEHDPEEERELAELVRDLDRVRARAMRLIEINRREDADHAARLRLDRTTNYAHTELHESAHQRASAA